VSGYDWPRLTIMAACDTTVAEWWGVNSCVAVHFFSLEFLYGLDSGRQ
jgi:hypothetical protein